jgi:hypothetical protein
MGEIRDAAAIGLPKWGEVFMRAYGSTTTYTSSNSFQNYGFNSSQTYGAIQAGASNVVLDDEFGALRLGLAGSSGSSQFDPSAPDG